MNPVIPLLLGTLLCVAVPSLVAQTVVNVDPSGHWEGTIQAPNMEVVIGMDLAMNHNGQLAGTFAQPSNGVKALPFSTVAVEGQSLRLVLKPSSGGGTFNGTVSKDGTSMSGDFITAEGGYSLRFTLARTGDAMIAPAPRSAPIGKELEGTWNGTLEAGERQLRIVLKMANQLDGTATGTIVSGDGSGVEIPIAITQKGSNVTIDVPAVGATFVGIVNTAGTELVGTWTQGPSVLPLTFRRAAASRDGR